MNYINTPLKLKTMAIVNPMASESLFYLYCALIDPITDSGTALFTQLHFLQCKAAVRK